MPTSGTVPTVKQTAHSILDAISDESIELIVVQNGPHVPHLQNVIEGLSSAGNKIRFVHEPTIGLLAGRHRGVRESNGELLVFVDDDIEVSAAWPTAIRNAFQDPNVAIAGGPTEPKFECKPPYWFSQFWHKTPDGIRTCGYLSLLDAGTSRRELPPQFVWGLNFSIRRDVLVDAGGFNPDGVPWSMRRYRGDGETGLAQKLRAKGLNATYEPQAGVRHIVPSNRLTLEYFEKRSYLQGISDSYTTIRQQHGLYSLPQREFRPLWKRVAGKVKNLITPSQSRPNTVEKTRIAAAYQQGYAFHQAEVAADPSLQEWVTRSNYWDFSYPKHSGTSCLSNT